MSEEQTPQTSETECGTVDSPEFEDEECWLYNGKGLLFKHDLKEESDPSGPEFRVSFKFPRIKGETMSSLPSFCFSYHLTPRF